MSELTEEQRKLLKRLADAEREARPFEHRRGVNYKSINTDDIQYPWSKIQGLESRKENYLCRSPAGSSANAQYRLSEKGWDELGENPP